jgi:hypothetical protein
MQVKGNYPPDQPRHAKVSPSGLRLCTYDNEPFFEPGYYCPFIASHLCYPKTFSPLWVPSGATLLLTAAGRSAVADISNAIEHHAQILLARLVAAAHNSASPEWRKGTREAIDSEEANRSPMTFIAECPFCRLKLRGVPERRTGESLECPRCHCAFTLAAMLHPPQELLRAEIPVGHKCVKTVEPVLAAGSDSATAVAARSEPKTVRKQIDEILAAELLTPPPTPKVVDGSRRTYAPNRWGVASLVLSSLALILASVPPLNLFTLPLAGLGAILGVRGLSFRGSVRGHSPAKSPRLFLAATGLAINAALIAAVLLVPSFFGRPALGWPAGRNLEAEKYTALTIGKPGEGSHPVAQESTWIDADKETVQFGGIRVRVVSVAMKPMDAKASAGSKKNQPQMLRVKLRVRNVAAVRGVPFPGWNVPDADGTRQDAVLLDDAGKRCDERASAPVHSELLRPGKFVDEVLVFAAPVRPVEFLRLELPAKAIGGTGLLRIQIPKKMIVRG